MPSLSSQIGTYFCIVKNAFGEVKSKDAIVTVSGRVDPMNDRKDLI